MLKCSRCGDYYIPGYLDCRCRTSLDQSDQFGQLQSVQPSNDAFATERPAGETKLTPVSIPLSDSSTTHSLSAGRSGQGPHQGREATC